jgi:hypothetical protein
MTSKNTVDKCVALHLVKSVCLIMCCGIFLQIESALQRFNLPSTQTYFVSICPWLQSPPKSILICWTKLNSALSPPLLPPFPPIIGRPEAPPAFYFTDILYTPE